MECSSTDGEELMGNRIERWLWGSVGSEKESCNRSDKTHHERGDLKKKSLHDFRENYVGVSIGRGLWL